MLIAVKSDTSGCSIEYYNEYLDVFIKKFLLICYIMRSKCINCIFVVKHVSRNKYLQGNR